MLRVKGWPKFQHYKKRNPPWIRLYRDLLEKKEWHKLSYASRSLAIAVWLIASENEDVACGIVTSDYEELAFRARMKDTDVIEAIKELIKQGFVEYLEPEQADLLAPRYQVATPETRDQTRDQSQIRPERAEVSEKPVDNGDKLPLEIRKEGSFKKIGSGSGQGGQGSGSAGYDVRDHFSEDEFASIVVMLNGCIHRSWDRKEVFAKYNNFVKSDPPKQPVVGFKAWVDKNRRWLSRAP